jgi:hypothetical protein
MDGRDVQRVRHRANTFAPLDFREINRSFESAAEVLGTESQFIRISVLSGMATYVHGPRSKYSVQSKVVRLDNT